VETSSISGKSLQLAKVGTLKRKRQIRDILTQQSTTNTLLDSTPMKAIKHGKIAFVDAMSPMSFGTPPVISKAKMRRKNSPSVFTPTNKEERVKQDRYIRELERRNKVNIGKPEQGESSKTSEVSKTSDVSRPSGGSISKGLWEEAKPGVDSDCSMDDYFGDSLSESD